MMPHSRRFLPVLHAFFLAALGCLAGGCSTSSDATYFGPVLNLREVREAPTGQLALIYDQPRPNPTGERVFFVDQNSLGLNLSSALSEIRANPGYGQATSGSIVVHRTHAQDAQGKEVFWAELDPFSLPGNWMPPLSEPPMSPYGLAQALPDSYNPPTTPPPQFAQQPGIQLLTDATASPQSAKPGAHFTWFTLDGPMDTTVPSQTLFPPSHVSFASKLGRAAEETADLAVATAVVVGVVTLDILALDHDSHETRPHPSNRR